MGKYGKAVMSVILLAVIFIFSKTTVQAAGLGVSVDKSSVNIGDSITLTVTVPSGYGATVSVTYDSSILELTSSSGNGVLLNLGDAMGLPSSGTITFKAKTSGTCTVSAAATTAGNAEGERVELSGARTSVTVANAVTGNDNSNNNAGTGGNGQTGNGQTGNGQTGNGQTGNGQTGNGQTGSDTPDPVKSADNSLSSLVLSAGELSPSFVYNTTKYTAEVDYNVTSLAITAITSNAKASIISMTGNENLQVGENKISIVVQAENGVKATYVITVTRKEQGGTTSEDPQPTEDDGEGEDVFLVNNVQMKPSEVIPEEQIPEEFSIEKIKIGAKEYPCLSFANGDVTLLYFEETGAGGSFFVYDREQNAIYPFIRFLAEGGYIIALLSDTDDLDESWEEVSLSVEGKGVLTAYKTARLQEDFYLIYAINDLGNHGWYQYDSRERTYQRYFDRTQEKPVVDTAKLQELEEENRQLNASMQSIIARKDLYKYTLVAAVAIIGLLLLAVLLLLFVRGKRGEEKEEDMDMIEVDTAERKQEKERGKKKKEREDEDDMTIESHKEKDKDKEKDKSGKIKRDRKKKKEEHEDDIVLESGREKEKGRGKNKEKNKEAEKENEEDDDLKFIDL